MNRIVPNIVPFRTLLLGTITITIICSLLFCYEYIILSIWPLEKNEAAIFQNVSRIKPVPSSDFVLPVWSKDTPIVFLHIGKAGGTSFDSAIPPILERLGKVFHFQIEHPG